MSAGHLFGAIGVAVAANSAVLTGPIAPSPAHADFCPAVEVVFARGTGQSSGVGQVGEAFVESLGSQLPGRSLRVYAVNYPATTAFATSAQTGADDVVARVKDMIVRCPNTRLVLGGFSQGASVMDLATKALPPEAVDHVAAIAVFGNPTSRLATDFTGAVFPRIGPPYSDKTIDQCAAGDPACSDGRNLKAHGSYAESGMTAQAADFVAARL